MTKGVPVFINCRDRVSDLRRLVDWLERAGHERIILLDNDSSYPPLLDYYETTTHEVVYLGANLGPRAVWEAELVPDELFVLTDPDVVPLDSCPTDAIDHLAALLERYPEWPKAGLGLYLEDVPSQIPNFAHEHDLVAEYRCLEPGVFGSFVDTTFALYRPGAEFDLVSLRTGAPYQARHMTWYVTDPDEELQYYLSHALAGTEGSTWAAERARMEAM